MKSSDPVSNEIKGIRVTIDVNFISIDVKHNLATHQYKRNSLFRTKESAIKRIAELIGVDITVK